MAKRKRFWILNGVIVLAVAFCATAFIIHYKNWVRFKENRFKILSGIYYRDIGFEEIDSIGVVEKLPGMEREHGFSAWAREKGIFKDSVIPGRRVHIFVDDLTQNKIKLVYRDSLVLYVNLPDSVQTDQLYRKLTAGKDSITDNF